MGNNISKPSTLQVLKIRQNTPSHEAKILPFLHFISHVNNNPIQSRADIKEMLSIWGERDLHLKIVDPRVDEPIEFVLPKQTDKQSLGMSVKFHEGDPSFLSLCVAEIKSDSPAMKAGLINEQDYIIGVENVYLMNEEEFLNHLFKNIGSPVVMIVYNSGMESLRRVEVIPENQNLLGCELNSGILYEIPEGNVFLDFECDTTRKGLYIQEQKLSIQNLDKTIVEEKREVSNPEKETSITEVKNKEIFDCVTESVHKINIKVNGGVNQNLPDEKVTMEDKVIINKEFNTEIEAGLQPTLALNTPANIDIANELGQNQYDLQDQIPSNHKNIEMDNNEQSVENNNEEITQQSNENIDQYVENNNDESTQRNLHNEEIENNFEETLVNNQESFEHNLFDFQDSKIEYKGEFQVDHPNYQESIQQDNEINMNIKEDNKNTWNGALLQIPPEEHVNGEFTPMMTADYTYNTNEEQTGNFNINSQRQDYNSNLQVHSGLEPEIIHQGVNNELNSENPMKSLLEQFTENDNTDINSLLLADLNKQDCVSEATIMSKEINDDVVNVETPENINAEFNNTNPPLNLKNEASSAERCSIMDSPPSVAIPNGVHPENSTEPFLENDLIGTNEPPFYLPTETPQHMENDDYTSDLIIDTQNRIPDSGILNTPLSCENDLGQYQGVHNAHITDLLAQSGEDYSFDDFLPGQQSALFQFENSSTNPIPENLQPIDYASSPAVVQSPRITREEGVSSDEKDLKLQKSSKQASSDPGSSSGDGVGSSYL